MMGNKLVYLTTKGLLLARRRPSRRPAELVERGNPKYGGRPRRASQPISSVIAVVLAGGSMQI